MKVAFGKITITPENVDGVRMAGYTRDHPAHGKLDDCYARAVLIEDIDFGNITKKLLLISLDTLKIPMVLSNYIKKKIQEKVDLALGPGNILIAAIHTHSAPDLTGEFYWPGTVVSTVRGIMFGGNRNDKYCVWVANQIVTLVKNLTTKLEPAKFAWAKKSILDDVVINRRHPARRTKQILGIFVFKNITTNKIIGILSNYGSHPTTMNKDNDKISAEYPGRVCARLEQLTQTDAGAVFFTAACGDINPITTCGTDFDHLESDLKARNTVYEQFGTYENTQKLGFMLADQAMELAQNIPESEFFNKFIFKSYIKTFWIPVQDKQPYIYNFGNWFSNKAILFVKKWFMFPVAITAAGKEPNFPGLTIKHYPFSLRRGWHVNAYTMNQYIEITAGAGSKEKKLGIIGVPGELFEDINKKFLARSPVGESDTFVFQEANDWVAYLFPIKEYITQAGYEPLASTTPIAGDAVEKEMYRLWEEIRSNMISYS